MKKTVLAGAAQIGTDSDISANLEKILAMIGRAPEAGCELLLFHEGCLTGYPDKEALARLDFERVAEAEEEIRSLAREKKLAILVGSTSRQGDRVYNDVMIQDEKGVPLGRYAKTWRAGEPWYAPGSGPVIFQICGIEATVLICADLRYPELIRLAVAAGAQIVFIANNEGGLEREDKLLGYRSMQISRATENHIYSVMANAPADPARFGRKNSSHGNSKIVDPLGNVLDEAGSFEERLVTAELDLTRANRSTVLRTIGVSEEHHGKYGKDPEHPAYAAWMKEGLKLVRRLGERK